MMKHLLTVGALVLSVTVLGQSRLVINDNAWVCIDNGAWVVIDHGSNTGIQTLGTGGNIRSEGENNRVRWRIANTINQDFVVPFTTASGVKMPFTYRPTAAGSGNGSLVFSTYNYGGFAPAWDNYNYRPSDVTHMSDAATGFSNNSGSGFAVDRFWIVDPTAAGFAYTTKPNAQLTFVIDRLDVTAGNAITANTVVGAQRFNSGTNRWGDFLPTGVFVPGATVNTVSAVIAPAADFYRSWTLADFANPLPVELVEFVGSCEGNVVQLRWTTATEQNNDYFTIERSRDATNWNAIGTMDGAGTSLSTINYSFIDEQPIGTAYYRLIQTDLDGTTTFSPVVAAGCEASDGQQIVNAWDDGANINVAVSSTYDDIHDFVLMDAQGKIMMTQARNAIATGVTTLTIPKGSIATGLYVIQLQNTSGALTRRILLN